MNDIKQSFLNALLPKIEQLIDQELEELKEDLLRFRDLEAEYQEKTAAMEAAHMEEITDMAVLLVKLLHYREKAK
jgi:hypothetical protein